MRIRAVGSVLLAFAAVFITLEVNSYTRKSATWDEPIHLTSGYAALAAQDYRVDPTHPPFIRVWAALPGWLADRPTVDTDAIERASLPGWLTDAYTFAHRFLYVDNDADRLLYAGRFMVVLLGVLLGGLLFCWVNEWLGLVPAVCALALYTVEPNLAAHATLVTTDLGVTCFMFGTVYLLWRTCRQCTGPNVAGLTACFALAIVTKFTAVLLVPIVLLLLAWAVYRRGMPPATAAGIVGVIAATTFVTIWAAYGFRYNPSATGSWSFHFNGTDIARGAPALAAVVGWVDSHQLFPNAFTEGLLFSQTAALELGAYLAGRISLDGWWYYFPLAFLIKTPLSLLGLVGIGTCLAVKRSNGGAAGVLPFVVVPVAVFMAAAMSGDINIGLRHILPIYPFALLIAAAAVARLIAMGRTGRAVVATIGVIALAEFVSVYPHNLTFFNQLVGGPSNGFRYLADSNLAWGQNLKPLKRWMDRNGVSHINLAYFGQADPEYYMIDCTYLPGSPTFALESVARPQLPGYVAISATVLTGVYLQPQWRVFYKPFTDMTPVAVIGNSIHVYWVERWPEAAPPQTDDDVEARRVLADTLLFGMGWPTLALSHYREYLERRPDEPGAVVNAGVALASMGEGEEAIKTFRRAVALAPRNGVAQLTLARALFAAGDLMGAEEHGQQAVVLIPRDPAAHDLLGRIRAVQGDFRAAAGFFEHALELDPNYSDARDHLELLAARSSAGPARRRAARGTG